MTELLTAAQMRAIEQAAIDSGEVTGLELMERAGRGVVEAILEWRPELGLSPHRAVVLCGPGNNGGDGFVVARLLKERGWGVEVFLYGDEAKLPPDAAENCRRWREMGEVSPLEWNEIDDVWGIDVRLVIDAVFGTGLSRAMPEKLYDDMLEVKADRISKAFDWAAEVVAVDLPSGLCSDSGRGMRQTWHRYIVDYPPLWADLTVTFHRAKVGHHLADGPDCCGRLIVADIGL